MKALVPLVLLLLGVTPLLAQSEPRDSAQAPPPDSATIASAYADAEARALVAAARLRRAATDRSIAEYRALATEDMSVGARVLWRERQLFRRETAAEVVWRREGEIEIDVVAAREVLPAFVEAPQVPVGLEKYVPHLAFDPAADRLFAGMSRRVFIRHPLAEGSEAHYRFRAGDRTVLGLPDGRRIRLRELVVTPRRADHRLLGGSLWIDEDSHAVVQALYHLARDYDFSMGGDGLPTWLFGRSTIGLEYVTIDYGLWEGRWWLPRLMAFEGLVRVGRVDLPFRYALAYSGYEVEAADPALPQPEPLSADTVACGSIVTIHVRVESGVGSADGPLDELAADTVAADPAAPDTAAAATDGPRPGCERYVVTVADDSALVASTLLSDDPYQSTGELLPAHALEELAARVGGLPVAPWSLSQPTYGWTASYNRVEGFAPGAEAGIDLGPAAVAGRVRLGLADLEPRGELRLSRSRGGLLFETAGYRRLAPMDVSARPFSPGASLSALLFARDEADYYDAAGLDLRASPSASRPQSWSLRVYAQRERAVTKETDFSVARLLGAADRFPPNLAAEAADQAGAELRLRRSGGYDPGAFRWSGEFGFGGAVGDHELASGSVTLGAALPLGRGLSLSAEGAAGRTIGSPAVQHLWYIGGPSSLRGYSPGVLSGEAFWRGRLELGAGPPALRLTLFSDVGWAGAGDDFGGGRPLYSAGLGFAAFDGLIRLDLARALRAPTGWRLSLYMDDLM